MHERTYPKLIISKAIIEWDMLCVRCVYVYTRTHVASQPRHVQSCNGMVCAMLVEFARSNFILLFAVLRAGSRNFDMMLPMPHAACMHVRTFPIQFFRDFYFGFDSFLVIFHEIFIIVISNQTS